MFIVYLNCAWFQFFALFIHCFIIDYYLQVCTDNVISLHFCLHAMRSEKCVYSVPLVTTQARYKKVIVKDWQFCWSISSLNTRREMKWIGFRPPLCIYRLNCMVLENLVGMVRWIRWHCPPDTGFEIRALAVWGRARYISVMEVSNSINSLRVSREEILCFFENWRSEWGSNPCSATFQAGSFNHCTRAPANRREVKSIWILFICLNASLLHCNFSLDTCLGDTTANCQSKYICCSIAGEGWCRNAICRM